MEFIITLVYWSMLLPYVLKESWGTAVMIGLSLIHAYPFLSLLIELFCTVHLMRKRHLFITIIVGIVYVVVNITVTFARGDPVYPILTWREWQSAVLVVGVVVLIIGGHMVLFWVTRWREERNREHVQAVIRSFREQGKGTVPLLNSQNTDGGMTPS